MIKFYCSVVLCCGATLASAQTAKVYRSGALLGTYSTCATASVAGNQPGDSIVLSAHTFYEHDVPAYSGQIWKGTMAAKDSTIVDAQNKGSGFAPISTVPRSIKFRDVIIQNGESDRGGGIKPPTDTLKLVGYTTIRNCHAIRTGGAVVWVWMYDHTKLINNSSDSCGGAAGYVYAYDSAEICYNSAKYGGAIAVAVSGGNEGYLYIFSHGVRIHHNKASVEGGGAIFAVGDIRGGQIIYNEAPVGSGIVWDDGLTTPLRDAHLYNPNISGKLNDQFRLKGWNAWIEGTWFGKSDTVGMIVRDYPTMGVVAGRHAICKWIINRGKPITRADTFFPVEAAFTYCDGTPLPSGSCPWLTGVFTANRGMFLTPNPTMPLNDTMRSMYRTFTHLPGDTGSRSVSFVCSVDMDTFKITVPVWGKTSINELSAFKEVAVYPNPIKDVLTVSGIAAQYKIALFDISGKLVRSVTAKTNITEIDCTNLPSGTYLLKLTDPDGNEGSAKVVKE